MELRVLEYFLAVAKEQSISKAAESLHLTQPTLSRQLKDMEDELGKQLLIRGNRQITLTEEGLILRKRAEEILSLVEKTENEITIDDNVIGGDIFIGTGESDALRTIGKIIKNIQEKYPLIHFHLVSGDSTDIIDRLDKGLFDFAILMDPVDISRYEYLRLPYLDINGLIMKKDHPLAKKKKITPKDLLGIPLIVSRQQTKTNLLKDWAGKYYKDFNIVTSFNLMYNATLLVDEGVGCVFGFDKIANTSSDSNLTFRPASPGLKVGMSIVWKQHQTFSKAANLFLKELENSL